jgi:hypothetical protein
MKANKNSQKRKHANTNQKRWFWRPQGVDEGLRFSIRFSSRGPGGVWSGGFHHFVFCSMEDLRIGSEDVWRFGGLVGEFAGDLNALSHKGSADFGICLV